jgi:hypothetical protein
MHPGWLKMCMTPHRRASHMLEHSASTCCAIPCPRKGGVRIVLLAMARYWNVATILQHNIPHCHPAALCGRSDLASSPLRKRQQSTSEGPAHHSAGAKGSNKSNDTDETDGGQVGEVGKQLGEAGYVRIHAWPAPLGTTSLGCG